MSSSLTRMAVRCACRPNLCGITSKHGCAEHELVVPYMEKVRHVPWPIASTSPRTAFRATWGGTQFWRYGLPLGSQSYTPHPRVLLRCAKSLSRHVISCIKTFIFKLIIRWLGHCYLCQIERVRRRDIGGPLKPPREWTSRRWLSLPYLSFRLPSMPPADVAHMAHIVWGVVNVGNHSLPWGRRRSRLQ